MLIGTTQNVIRAGLRAFEVACKPLLAHINQVEIIGVLEGLEHSYLALIFAVGVMRECGLLRYSPTGHASLMKSSSDDMLDLLLSEDSEEGRRARELLLHNTQLNSSSPPTSVRSWDCDSSSSPRGLNGAATGPSDDISLTENLTANERQGQSSDSAPFSSSGGVLCILECHIASSS